MNQKLSLIRFITFLFCINLLSAQNSNDNNHTFQGVWELETIYASRENPKSILNIKYSETYKRYFGTIVSAGETTTLDSLSINNSTNTLTFSSHRRNNDKFDLVINGNTIEGTLESDHEHFSIKGKKVDNVSPTNITEYGKYSPTIIPDDVNELYLEYGNTESNTVLLIVQGGPFDKIQYSNGFDKWKDKLNIAIVKQAQILNPSILPPENNIGLSDAYRENLISVEILHKVIKHFKNENKKVMVWGISYGAWIIQKYISLHGIEADAVSIAAGRLDIEEDIWKKGKLNQTVYDITYKGKQRVYTELGFTFSKPTAFMLASINEERFTETLKDRDLSKLIVYQYGKKDGTVGRLLDSEIEFLKSKNVELEVCKKCYHRQMMSHNIVDSAIKKMLEAI